MKVLIADKFERSGLEGLAQAGLSVHYEPELKDESLTDALRTTQAEVLVVRSTKVTAAMMDAGRLALIVRAGAGVNTIDVKAASSRGIYVSNCPGKNSIAVAELVMGLILSIDRRIPDNVQSLREGRWNKKEYSTAPGLYGQTLGLLGLGNIGLEVARRAHAFGIKIVAWDVRLDGQSRRMYPSDHRLLGAPADFETPIHLLPSAREVAQACDILSIHVALVDATRGMLNQELLDCLKPGAMLINAARGELMNAEALSAAIKGRKLRVGLDVFSQEPTGAVGEFGDPIVQFPSVYGTHHIGASTTQAQEAIAAETVRIIATYHNTGRVPNVVNLCSSTPARHMLVVRHLDRPGVLAHVFEQLRAAHINVQETENIIFEGAIAAIARINLDGEPSAEMLDAIRTGNEHILDLRLLALG